MKQHNTNLELLMAKFLNGETSIQEEEILQGAFRCGNIPSEMENYRGMMQWYSDTYEPERETKLRHTSRGRFTAILKYMSVAASVAVVALLTVMAVRFNRGNTELAETYAGSFVIINGEKHTDIKEILPYLQSVEAEIAEARKVRSWKQSFVEEEEDPLARHIIEKTLKL